MGANESISFQKRISSSFDELDPDNYFNLNQASMFLSEKDNSQSNIKNFDVDFQNIFVIESTKTQENTNNNNDEIKSNKNESVKEFDELDNTNTNQQLIFNSVKIGRPKKSEKNKEEKYHNKNSYDNARKKIFNSCKMSIYDFITEFTNIKLHVPTIEKQMGYSYKNNFKFLHKTIYDIFIDSSPKRVKDEIKNNRENYNYNKIEINKLLEKENNNPNVIIKIFNKIFNLTFGDFLLAYLNDEKEIKIGGENICLKKFKTFGQCFNERKNNYTQSQKDLYKKHILDIIENKKSYRRPRAIKH